ncbi:hypothetical protein [uncultured Microbacterium sp.]|uniref:hypothetical protein n=1 Tax=uncultured Microbacterium sp. TaxID=191216 RepID=UPI0032B24B82
MSAPHSPVLVDLRLDESLVGEGSDHTRGDQSQRNDGVDRVAPFAVFAVFAVLVIKVTNDRLRVEAGVPFRS